MNMAIDEALLMAAQLPTLRSYRWLLESVSFGYFEKYGKIHATYSTREPVRRYTGGGVVLHGADFTYSLVVPRSFKWARQDALATYRAVHECIANVLQADSIPARLVADAADLHSHLCFAQPSPGDIVVGTTKIAGAAQRRCRFGLLHQGSVQNVRLPVTFIERLAAALATRWEIAELTARQLETAETLSSNKYASEEWLKRFP